MQAAVPDRGNWVRFAALILWAGTAGIGLYLLITSLAGRKIKQEPARVTKYPALLVPSHPVLALTGLGLWVCYLIEHQVGYAWAAFGVLCGTVLLGFALLTRWLTGIGGRHVSAEASHPAAWAVLLHGLSALVTFVLVMITATIMSHG
jgi:hypothetical protein